MFTLETRVGRLACIPAKVAFYVISAALTSKLIVIFLGNHHTQTLKQQVHAIRCRVAPLQLPGSVLQQILYQTLPGGSCRVGLYGSDMVCLLSVADCQQNAVKLC